MDSNHGPTALLTINGEYLMKKRSNQPFAAAALRPVTLGLALAGALVSMPALAEIVEVDGSYVERSQVSAMRAQMAPAVGEHLEHSGSMASFGDNQSSWTFGACDSGVRNPATLPIASNCNIASAASGSSASLGFPLHLPHGSKITHVHYWYYDNHATSDVGAGLTRANNTGGTATVLSLSSPSFSGGNNEFLSTTIAHTVDNFNYSYYINMILDNNGAGQQERFYRGAVFYTLQAAPAPATASFLDVPTTSPFHRYVEALVDAGTTSGCGGGNFCPDAPVTRAQMAVFLTQLLGLSWDAHSTP